MTRHQEEMAYQLRIAELEAEVSRLTQERDEALRLLETATELVDSLRDVDPCHFDHHGYCQTHAWFHDDERCADKRAAEFMDMMEDRTQSTPVAEPQEERATVADSATVQSEGREQER